MLIASDVIGGSIAGKRSPGVLFAIDEKANNDVVPVPGEAASSNPLEERVRKLVEDFSTHRFSPVYWFTQYTLKETRENQALVLPALIEVLKIDNPYLQEQASSVIYYNRFGESAKDASPALVEALKNIENPHDGSAVVFTLVAIGKPAVPALIEGLKSSNQLVCKNAAYVLGEIGKNTKDALPALIENLNHNNTNVRSSSAYALGQICEGESFVIKALVKSLNDSYEMVRICAANGLGKLGPIASEAVPELIKKLEEDSSLYVRVGAAIALGGVGTGVKEVVPAVNI